MGKREILCWLLITVIGTVAATYLVRGIDWLAPQLPIVISALLAAIEWLSLYGWELLLHQPSLQAILMVALSMVVLGRRTDSGIEALSKLVIERVIRRLPRDQRDRWREELLGELGYLNERPLSGLVFALRAARLPSRIPA
ncbi:MAG TPA: hypothetical protein VFT79_02830 [Solirubrobacterales bacterium]|nr:hypothetical protein [Solirubrobacterales bacterium]